MGAKKSPENPTLASLNPGERARILRVEWSALAEDEARRLSALGFEVGAEVELAFRGVFGARDPLAVSVGGRMIALRRAHALAMAVE